MKASSVNVSVLDSLHEDKAKTWDKWVPDGQLSLTRRFLLCALNVEISGFRFIPLVLHKKGGETCGVAAAYYNVLDGAELGGGTMQRRVQGLRRLLPNLLRFSVLEIGNPTALAFPVRASVPGKAGVEALALWATNLVKQGKAQLVVIRDFAGEDSRALSQSLRHLKFQPVPLPFLYIVPLGFSSFDAYRAAMRTRYRSRLDACMRDTADLRVEVLSDFTHLAGDMYRLWRDLFDRAKRYHRVVLTEAFFASIGRLPDTQVLLLRRADGELAGFGMLFRDGPVLRYSATGFTREAAVEDGVYFRLLYEVVRYGIDNGFTMVNLGATTAGPKMSIGGQPVALHAWMWHPFALHRRVLGYLTRALMQPEVPVVRNVFRTTIDIPSDPSLVENVAAINSCG